MIVIARGITDQTAHVSPYGIDVERAVRKSIYVVMRLNTRRTGIIIGVRRFSMQSKAAHFFYDRPNKF